MPGATTRTAAHAVGSARSGLTARDAARLADHATRIPVTLRGDALTIPGHLDDRAVTVRFDTAPHAPPPLPATLSVTISGATLPGRRDADGGVSIGWDALAGRRVVLDLPHGALWLD